MDYQKFKVNGENKVSISDFQTNSGDAKEFKEKIIEETAKNLVEISLLQEKLYSDSKEGLIIVLQAMDAAGKDSTIKHVMKGINPQGVMVTSFKKPTSNELEHDFLWRANRALPKRGYIAIFNRSYYEDVLVVKVRKLYENYSMPKRCIGDDIIKKRYKHIKNYEDYLYDEGFRVVKIFLNVSKDEQKERFLERIDLKIKNWKFSEADVRERQLWDKYQEAYEDLINATSTKCNPWYVVPANAKWYTRFIVSEILLETLKDINPQFPTLPEEKLKNLANERELLMNEQN